MNHDELRREAQRLWDSLPERPGFQPTMSLAPLGVVCPTPEGLDEHPDDQ